MHVFIVTKIVGLSMNLKKSKNIMNSNVTSAKKSLIPCQISLDIGSQTMYNLLRFVENSKVENALLEMRNAGLIRKKRVKIMDEGNK